MSPMLRRFTSVADCTDRAMPFLLMHEAAHCLPLGLLANLRHAKAGAAPPAPPLPEVKLVWEGDKWGWLRTAAIAALGAGAAVAGMMWLGI